MIHNLKIIFLGLACEAKTMRRCIITITVAVCDLWSNSKYGSKKTLLIPEVAWVHTCLIFEKTRIAHATKSHPGLEPKGGRCAVLGCSGIFGFIHIENSISAIPSEPFVLKMLWPVAISGAADCWISRSEGKCFKLKECSRAHRWGEARLCASQPYFNLALFVDDNSPFMTSVTPDPTEIATAVLFFKELVISLP